MTTVFNDTFRHLLTEYNLSEDFSYPVDIPTKVQQTLDSTIVVTELGVTLESLNNLYKATTDWENQSTIEDNENHFHVDCFVYPADNKQAFMLGVKTLALLAGRFQNEQVTGIKFSYSFQTPELGKQWAKADNLDEEVDEHFISDRLSFFTNRDNEKIISDELFSSPFWAMLTIDT